LPADAAVLIAAKGEIGAVGSAAVDAQAAGSNASGHRQRPLQRSGVHAPGQPIDAVVGDSHRVIIVLERDHDKDGAEDLFLGDRHRVVHVGEQGGLDVPALRQMGRATATEGQRRTLLDALLDVAQHPVALLRRDQRAHHHIGALRVAVGNIGKSGLE